MPKGFNKVATGTAAAAGSGPIMASALSTSISFFALSAATVGSLAESSLINLIYLPAILPPNSFIASSAAANIQGFGVALVPVKQARFPMTIGFLMAGCEYKLGAITNKRNMKEIVTNTIKFLFLI